MTGQFKVGEIAILQNLVGEGATCYNGTECEVIAPLEARRMMIFPIVVECYVVRDCDGNFRYAMPMMLRKKQPPQEDSDRNTVVEWKDCGWQPNKVPASDQPASQ